MSKFLDYEGLRYFKEKLDLEYDGKYAAPEDIPTPDGETIVSNNNVWSANLPANGAITSDSNGLKLDLSKIAGDTISVSNSDKLEVVIDGTTIVKGSEDQVSHKYPLEVSLDGIADGTTIINNNGDLSVGLDNIIDDNTIINDGGVLKVDVEALDIPPAYELPTATSSVKGGVKIGDGVTMTGVSSDVLAVEAANNTITVTSSGIAVTPNKFCPLTDAAPGEPHGMIPEDYLPSYVDDVIEGWLEPEDATIWVYNPETETFSEETLDADTFFAARIEKPDTDPTEYGYYKAVTPEASKIYVDLSDTDTYRWSGSVYVNISGAAIDIISESEIDALFPESEEEEEP